MEPAPSSLTPRIPSYLIDGHSPLSVSSETLGEKEIGPSFAQTQNSDRSYHVVNLDGSNGHFPEAYTGTNIDGSNCHEGHRMAYSEIDVKWCNDSGPPRTPLATNHTQSYIQHPTTLNADDLSWPSQGTLQRKTATEKEKEERVAKLSGAVKTILECVGEDPNREGLLDTPERYAKAMLFFTKGYEENLQAIVNGAVFHEDHHEMVIVKDIEFFSLCEHHLVPFSGKMHIGYIPDRRVIGLSKIVRIVEMFSRRLQIQERLTKQVGLALFRILQPQGVAVVVESSHLCMVMRGVQKSRTITTTSCMLGCLLSTAATREEFWNCIKRK
ncbi:GTP cyclohydrolase I [Xylogone sp. PMI_703]|nr:GTP cyclohydrolase I [Xylogone sp. PMI_703]